jgi:hypothetical protein
MIRLKAQRVDSSNGEIHFVLEDSQSYEHTSNLKDSEIAEIKRTTRKEAEKPLMLMREE